jgi:hypothetical protein
MDTVLLLQRGPVISDDDLPRLRGIAEGMWQLPASERLMLLEWLGIRGVAAEGIVAAGDAAGIPVAAAAGQAALAATPPFPFGDWKLPGKMPVPFYIGNEVHVQIGLEYESFHASAVEQVFIDEPVAAIAVQLSEGLLITPDVIEAALADARPDIIEFSSIHPEAIGDLFGYEIKPEGSEGLASAEWIYYQRAFYEAGMPLLAGPTTLPGTSGIVAAPNGWAQYNSPAPGVISYKLIRASAEAIKKRDEEKGRADTSEYPGQAALETLGWVTVVAVVAALIAAALYVFLGVALPAILITAIAAG